MRPAGLVADLWVAFVVDWVFLADKVSGEFTCLILNLIHVLLCKPKKKHLIDQGKHIDDMQMIYIKHLILD